MAATDPSEAGASGFDAARLRSAMGRFPTGVTVVTALTEAGPAGLAANAVSSLSLAPPLMLACLDRGSRTLRAVEAAGRFGINVLGADGVGLVAAFGSKGPIGEKWAGVAWSEAAGVPRLDEAIVWIACDLRDVISGGDHVIVTGEVRDVSEREGRPLLFHEGEYRGL
jgi:flavin reductase (DIM6/NTAB) family NADH-FMN oxidoreductase RutF